MASGRIHAADALLPSGWARDVLLEWQAGAITAATPDTQPAPDVSHAAGPVVPGMPNLHSHAFQRVFAGLTEVRRSDTDDFWSWRQAMYRAANTLTPEDLEAVATWAYIEMLEGGYTSVCEFHYLHNDRDGRPYADAALLSRILARAAATAGIGLTLLPVLYQQGGFGGVPPADGQRRFIRTTESLLHLVETMRSECAARGGRVGLALHSLRAVAPEAIRDALGGVEALDPTAPRHIHVAEQTREVEECLAWCGARPVEWLLHHVGLDSRWCLVHATHLIGDEMSRASRTGAVAGLCPTTEANLGDGVFDWCSWTSASTSDSPVGQWGVGSDSHVTLDAAEELRALEYSQRLTVGRRNVAARESQPHVGTAMTLAAVAGGARASGRPVAGLAVGQRADFVVLDASHPLLEGLTASQALDTRIFAGRWPVLDTAWVGGVRVVDRGRHLARADAAAAFSAVRRALAVSG